MSFLHAMTVLGYLPKLKEGLGLAFGAHFLYDFFHKNVFYLILYQWAKFQCHAFPRYQTIYVIEFIFTQLMMSQTIRFMLDQPLRQWLTGRKKGEDGNTKIWVSRERKELFRWNKKRFS